MKIRIISLLFSLLCATTWGQQQGDRGILWADTLSTAANIARNAVAMQDDEQWDFIEEIVKEKSIIVLGEQMHFDITSTTARIGLLRKLHECGFTTLVFEMAPMLSGYAFGRLPSGIRITTEELLYYSPWLMDRESIAPILQMLDSGYFKFFGMDCDIVFSDFLVAKKILDGYPQTDDLTIPWFQLHRLWAQLQSHSHDPESITSGELFEYISILNQIRNRVDCLIDQYGMTTDFSAIKQWLRNMDRNFFDFSSRLKYRVFGGLLGSMRVQIRDNAMAENVLWYRKHFPDEKLIIWCANLHAVKDASQIMDCELNDYYHNLLTENLYHELGNEVYSIAITSLNRSDLQQPGELERQIAHFTRDAPYAFINCERLRWLDGYRTAVFEFPEVGKRKNGHWLNIVDGIYYIRDIECMQLNNKTEEPENLQTE